MTGLSAVTSITEVLDVLVDAVLIQIVYSPGYVGLRVPRLRVTNAQAFIFILARRPAVVLPEREN
jgi:hypothetical protein